MATHTIPVTRIILGLKREQLSSLSQDGISGITAESANHGMESVNQSQVSLDITGYNQAFVFVQSFTISFHVSKVF